MTNTTVYLSGFNAPYAHLNGAMPMKITKDFEVYQILVRLSCDKKPMFDELENYKETGHFFFSMEDDFRANCNAPSGMRGIFLIYVLKKSGGDELYYIGNSEPGLASGSQLTSFKAGLREAIVDGWYDHNEDGLQLIQAMKRQGIIALDIYWYIKDTANSSDNPIQLRKRLLRRFEHPSLNHIQIPPDCDLPFHNLYFTCVFRNNK